MYVINVCMKVSESIGVQRRAFTLDAAAAICGVSYHTLYRAICRGHLRALTGFGRMMVSDRELDRFLGKTSEYKPRKGRNNVGQ
jgi:helix-turn-helix protein